MTNIISAHGPHDFLAIVPYLTGFLPERSLVLVAMRGNRSCGALRFDLPAAGSRAVLKRVATSFVGMLCKIPDVDALVPVVYTDEKIDGGHAPYAELVSVLCERARYSGFLVRDALCVAANGWGSYLDLPWPEGGHPLSMIADSPAALELPSDPRERPRSVAEGCTLPVVTEKARRDTARAVSRLRKAHDDQNALAWPDWDDDATTEFVSLVEELIDLDVDLGTDPEFDSDFEFDPDADFHPDRGPSLDAAFGAAFGTSPGVAILSPNEAALAIWALRPAMARDAALLQWSFGAAMGQRVVEESLEFMAHPSSDSGDEETTRLLLGVGPRPDPRRIERAISVLKGLAALAPRDSLVSLLTMLAWLNWALGLGSIAGGFIDRARRIEPEDGFAALLDTILSSGHLPEWAFQVPPQHASTSAA